MKAVGHDWRRGGMHMRKPRRRVRHRRSSPFERCKRYSTVTPRQKQHCTAEMHQRRPSQSACPTAIWCRKQVFSGSDGGIGRGIRTGLCDIHWFLHKFNVDLVDALRAFKAAARLIMMCPANAPLLNPTPASVQWPQQLRAFPFLDEDTGIIDYLCQELPAYMYLARAEGVSLERFRDRQTTNTNTCG